MMIQNHLKHRETDVLTFLEWFLCDSLHLMADLLELHHSGTAPERFQRSFIVYLQKAGSKGGSGAVPLWDRASGWPAFSSRCLTRGNRPPAGATATRQSKMIWVTEKHTRRLRLGPGSRGAMPSASWGVGSDDGRQLHRN